MPVAYSSSSLHDHRAACSPGRVNLLATVLADCAQSRDGLLFVLGGGVTRIAWKAFPARLDRDRALLLELHPSECGRPHDIRAVVQDAGGHQLAEVALRLQTDLPATLDPGETIVVPSILVLSAAQIPRPGRYTVDLLVNGEHRQSLGFVAALR